MTVEENPVAVALKHIKEVRATGDGFASFDAAKQAMESQRQSLALAYHAILQAARLGAQSEALQLYATIAQRIEGGETDPLVPLEDLLSLYPRLRKDEALEDTGPDRAVHLAEVARLYFKVFETTNGHYPLVNAADLFDLAGEAEDAARCARLTLELLETPPPPAQAWDIPWRLRSKLEARLVLGDLAGAHDAAREVRDDARAAQEAAGAAHPDYSDLGTTVRQLGRLARVKGLAFDVGSELGMPGVLCYSGHIIAAPGRDGRFPAAQEGEVAAAIERFLDTRRVGWAYGSLAAGADILVVEALQRRGAETHVVLPFAKEDFIEASVRRAGEEWVGRFEAALAKATRCRTVVDGSYYNDSALFGLCTKYAIGLARLQATHLGAGLTQLLVWDGKDGLDKAAGTSADHRLGQSVGIAQHIVPVRPQVGAAPPPSPLPATSAADVLPMSLKRRAKAMVFCDVVHFSKIADDDLPQFHVEIMRPMAKAIHALAAAPSVVETWGDAVFLVYDGVEEAANGAVTLLEAVTTPDRTGWNLPPELNLRVSAHFGSTFDITNPFTGKPGCLGAHVSRAARIEPVTPPGTVFVSEAFAAQLAILPRSRFRADFVGTTALAKQFGSLPVFRLIKTAASADGAR
jgi:class 3 adenylate cyclase